MLGVILYHHVGSVYHHIDHDLGIVCGGISHKGHYILSVFTGQGLCSSRFATDHIARRSCRFTGSVFSRHNGIAHFPYAGGGCLRNRLL